MDIDPGRHFIDGSSQGIAAVLNFAEPASELNERANDNIEVRAQPSGKV